MANSGCLCPVIVAGWRAGRLGVVKLLLITRYGVVVHRQYRVFDGGVAGAVAGPLHWRAGWQTGSLARPIALNAYSRVHLCELLEERFQLAITIMG